MNWKQHMWIGIGAGLAFFIFMYWKFAWYPLNPITVAQAIVIIGISGLLMDLDHESGKLHQWLMGIGSIVAIVGAIGWYLNSQLGLKLIEGMWQLPLIAGVIITALTFFTAQFSHHRGWMHSIPFCLIYGTFIYILTAFNLQMGVLGTVGCYSHLVADGEFLKMR